MKRDLFLKNIVKAVLAALLLSLSLKAANSDIDLIKKSIIGYNMQLITAAKDEHFLKSFDDMKKFERFADKRVAQKLYIWIKSWHENNLYMDARLLDITFGKIVPKNNRVDVVTDEVWLYRYFRLINENEKREAYSPAKKLYKVKYSLEKRGKRWKIVSIDIFYENEQKLNRKRFQ